MTPVAATDTNDIPTRQNTPEALDCQAAAKLLYRRAELLFYLQFALGVIVPVLVAIANLVLPQLPFAVNVTRTSFAAWGALYGLVIMLLDELVFDDWQQGWKRSAATAQEMFDTTLFKLSWRTTKVGTPLEGSDVHNWAKTWRRGDPSLKKVRDWYAPIVGCVPLHLARVLCQRTNLWWDSRLRQRYGFILGAFAVVLAVLAAAVFKYLGLDVDGLLLATVTLAPAFRWAIRERRRQLAAASTLDRLCSRARELHDDIAAHRVDLLDAGRQSRELQDDIFDHRKSVPIGLSWLYNILRPHFEVGMRVDAERSVRDYREQHGLPQCEGAA
ncbi:MAG: S-4TM family putative pore-forming effector [Gemmatimonadaceae bacterium]